MTESERDKLNAIWENLYTNNLQSNLLKQHWVPFSNLSGTIHNMLGTISERKACHRKNVKFHVTRHWLELANQWLEVTRQFLRLDQVMTRLKNFRWLLLDSNSKGCDFDSTEMTQAHHCLIVRAKHCRQLSKQYAYLLLKGMYFRICSAPQFKLFGMPCFN